MSNRLVLLGDSLMKGVMFSSERNRYMMYDDSWFIGAARRRGTDIVKHCKMGATIEFGLDSTDCIQAGDKVVIEFGGNDSNYDWSVVAADPLAEHSANTPPEKFKRLYAETIKRVREVGAEPIVSNLIPIDSESFFRWISKTADGASVLKWLGDENMLYRWHEYYSRMIEETAFENGCRILDIRGELLKTRQFYRLLSSDGLHPNEEGHTRIRNLMLEAIC